MNDPQPDIDRLISLYLRQRASERERRQLMRWAQESPHNRRVLDRLEEIWRASPDRELPAHWQPLRDEIWHAGTKQRPARVPRSSRTSYWGKVAAVFFIFLGGLAWLWYSINQQPVSPPEPIARVEKVNPAGQHSTHRLPDGTRVSLNAASRLEYPERFADTLRLVRLVGEAFFDVAQDAQRPFVVAAAGTRTQALGTAFSIRAYPEDDTIEVALLEGKVRVRTNDRLQAATLSPGEALQVTDNPQRVSRRPFNYERTLGWKDGLLVFDGTDFATFRRTIEKWYGVRVAVRGTPPTDWQVRARYRREDLRHVLRDISFNKSINFELNDKNVLLIF